MVKIDGYARQTGSFLIPAHGATVASQLGFGENELKKRDEHDHYDHRHGNAPEIARAYDLELRYLSVDGVAFSIKIDQAPYDRGSAQGGYHGNDMDLSREKSVHRADEHPGEHGKKSRQRPMHGTLKPQRQSRGERQGGADRNVESSSYDHEGGSYGHDAHDSTLPKNIHEVLGGEKIGRQKGNAQGEHEKAYEQTVAFYDFLVVSCLATLDVCDGFTHCSPRSFF
jgi:hypothetical protein